jgi:hypothetical protein
MAGPALGFICHMDIFLVPGTDTDLPFAPAVSGVGARGGRGGAHG